MDLTGNGDRLTTGDRFARSYARKHGLPDPTTAPETTMLLTFSASTADAYPIGDAGHQFTLAEAIEAESHNAASEADSDHLPDPGEEAREAFRQRVERDATARLRQVGDSYTDPIGVTWRLIADPSY